MIEKSYYSAEDLVEILLARGCIQTVEVWRGGRIWQGPDGSKFSVPPPPRPEGYTRREIDDIMVNGCVADIARH